MGYILLGVALLIGGILLAQWFASASPGQVARVLRIGYFVLTLVLALFFFATGRVSWGLIALVAMLAGAGGEITRRRVGRRSAAAGAGQGSEIETRFLRVTLDHDSGQMDGEVLSGVFAGKKLSDMALADLLALLAHCQAEDAQSAQVLEAYLDHSHGDWRRRAGGGRGAKSSSGPMSRKEAWETLGLKQGASDTEIKKAHRRLMTKAHPDHGGSTSLAARINEAKEILLGK